MAMGGFCQNVVGPPEWECEAMGSVVWVQCANLCRVSVFDLSIVASSVMGLSSYCWKYALEAIIKGLLLYFLVHDNCLLFML